MTCVAQGYRRSVATGVETGSVQAGELEFAYLRAGGDGPLALCLHGFPDTPHTWRHLLPRLAERGYRAVAPFSRGYAPTGVPSDGVYQTGALAADANALHDALGGDGDAVIIGHDWGAVATYGAAAHEPHRWARVVGLAVPPAGAVAAAFVSNVDQLQRSWYMFFFQHPLSDLIVPANDFAFVERLWSQWSPGFDASTDLPHVRQSLADPANLQAALGYYRAALGNGPIDRAVRAGAGGDESRASAADALPARPRRRRDRRRGGRSSGGDDCRRRARHDRGARRLRPLPAPRTAGCCQRTRPGVPVVSARPNLPDGLVVVVKEECETCRMVAPLLPSIAEHGPLTVFTQDDPEFPKELEAVHDADLAVSWHHDIETVPTLVRVVDGVEAERTVGWSQSEWRRITGIGDLGADLPPMRPGCGSLSVDPDRVDELRVRFEGGRLRSRRIELAALEDDIEAMFARGWTDGLPVVPPTEQRVLAMLDGTTRAADDVVASVPPDLVDVTVEKVAIAAVMAGCRPEYLPWVLTVIEAVCTDEFNMHGVLATTMPVGPVIVCSGPGTVAIGMNSGVNALGQGNRANLTIGRAVQLVVRNVGGGRPGGVDRATHGNPGKLSFCFAERARLAVRNAGGEPRRTGGGQRHHGVRRRRAAVHRRPAVAGAGEPRQIAGRVPADVAPPQARAGVRRRSSSWDRSTRGCSRTPAGIASACSPSSTPACSCRGRSWCAAPEASPRECPSSSLTRRCRSSARAACCWPLPVARLGCSRR